jgi:hypothetical protein
LGEVSPSRSLQGSSGLLASARDKLPSLFHPSGNFDCLCGSGRWLFNPYRYHCNLTLRIQHQQAKIQHQQAETNRNQLRLHLFDRRWDVYKVAIDFIDIVSARADIPGEDLWEFAVAIRGARFLFDQSVQDYCDEASAVRFEKVLIDSPLGRTQDEHKQSVKAQSDRLVWFTEQAAEIERRFAPFLQTIG